MLGRAWPTLLASGVLGAAAGAGVAFMRPDLAAFLPLTGPALWAAAAALTAGALVLLMAALLALRSPPRVSATTAERLADMAQAPVLALAPVLSARDLRQVAPDLRHPAGLLVSAPEALFSQAVRIAAARILRWRSGEAGMSVGVIAPRLRTWRWPPRQRASAWCWWTPTPGNAR